jgi:hypothetical protein
MKMDCTNFIKQKKAFTVNAPASLLKLFSLASIILLPITSSWAFETNDNSKIAANLEVTGTLIVGAVNGASTSDAIITNSEGISDAADNNTLPTTWAVKQYVDAYVDAQVAASSGGYPEEVSTFTADSGNFASALAHCKNKSGDWRLPSVSELINLSSEPHSFWTTDIDSGKYVAVNPTTGSFSLETPSSGWAYFICVR